MGGYLPILISLERSDEETGSVFSHELYARLGESLGRKRENLQATTAGKPQARVVERN